MKRVKRVLTGMMAAIILVTLCTSGVCAEDAAAGEEKTAEEEKTPEQLAAEEEAAAQAVYEKAPETNVIKNWPQGPCVYGEGAIVMDMNSGAILYGKCVDGHFYPASITKLLTALVALENSQLTDQVTFTDASVDFLEYGDASVGMRPGEVITMEQALYAMLLASANEVAHAIGENATDGGYDDFIKKMNEEVKSLGGTNSNFTNTNGLHDENHYTCARDMALISSALFEYDEFRTIEKALTYTIPPTNLEASPRSWIEQNHKMLWDVNDNYYPYAVAGKTGYTDQALSTLVTFADNGTLQLVCVELKTHGVHVYPDTEAMLEYGFHNFTKLSLKDNAKTDKIGSFKDDAAYVVVPNGVSYADLDEEIVRDEGSQKKEGTVFYTYEGQDVGRADIVISDSYYKELSGSKEVKLDKAAGKTDDTSADVQEGSKKIMIVIAGIVLAAVIIFIIVLAVMRHRKKVRLRRRQAAMRRRREEELRPRKRRQRDDSD